MNEQPVVVDTGLRFSSYGVRWVDMPAIRICPCITSKALQIGYGRVQAHLLDALESAGGIEFAEETDFRWDYRLFFGWPRSWMIGHDKELVGDIIFHTMWEHEVLPPGWADVLNRIQLIWVPSKWCEQTFRAAGVTRPIMVSGYGADPLEFPHIKRPDGPFTFIVIGHALEDRKGAFAVWKAFNKLKFKGELKDARLIVKTQKGLFDDLHIRLHDKDGNSFQAKDSHGNKADGVDFIFGTMPQKEYALMMARAHCMVYPQVGEGFGLIPLEFACTGGLAMVHDYAGCSEYVDNRHMVKLDNASEQELMDKMLWAYANQDEVTKRGAAAAAWVRTEWTWELAGLRARQLLHEKIGR